MGSQCPYHTDHENRIKRLEEQMEKMLESNPKMVIAAFSFIGVVFSTTGTIIGILLTAYLKSKGVM